MKRVGYILAVLLLASGIASAQIEEYRVKAAFLYNFAKFVEWPAGRFRTASDPLTICVLGQNPFGGLLDETVSGKTVEGREFEIHGLNDPREACHCHILFAGAGEWKRLRSLVPEIKGAGILTVGESTGEEGAVIRFRLEGSRVRLEINLAAAEYENLRISSKLLSLAHVVRRPL